MKFRIGVLYKNVLIRLDFHTHRFIKPALYLNIIDFLRSDQSHKFWYTI
jgi:hypothetical protein